jgi:hypothetical protein
MKLISRVSPSILTVFIIFLFCVSTAHINKIWCGDGSTPFCYDMKQYYSYLPKFLIEHDMDFKNRGDYWLDALPDGRPFMKYSCGMALLEAPFFLLAWLTSDLLNIPIEGGYSKVFNEFVHYGMFLYFLLGLIYLRKTLRHFQFNEMAISITLLTVFFGTNLYHYILGQGLMTHGFLFSLHSIFLYLIIKFYNKPKTTISLMLGLVGGLITLIRPTEILCFIVLFLWNVNSWKIFKSRLIFFTKNYMLLFMIAVTFVIVWIPQMLYWNYITGNLILYSYTGETLFFEDPKILEILFSPRNGLLPYCPVLLLFLVSLFIPNTGKNCKLAIVVFVVLNIYIVSCWWCWWYGGSFGARALIQIYPYLSISFAGMLHFLYNHLKIRTYIKISLNLTTLLLVVLHLKFWYQWKKGYVHYDSMTKEAYWFIFPKLDLNGEEIEKNWTLLITPDYEEAKKGIR